MKTNKTINVTKSSLPKFEDYCKEIKELWKSRWLSNRGVKHKLFEEALQNYLEAPFVSLFANGHLALEVTLAALKLKGEVITTPYTHVSTTHSIVRSGLKPVFCDINSRDFNIDASKIESLITDQTSAIMPVHVYGNPCQVNEIDKIAKKYNLKVIYDAAHAFGVKIGEKNIACFGDASMFSLHATKIFNSIEGGITVFKDKDVFQTIDPITNFGFTSHETIDYVGTNARMNEFEAAMGLCNLRIIENEFNKRKIVVDRYEKLLKDISGIKLIIPDKNIKRNYSYFAVLFDGYKKNRNQIFQELKNHNINARKYFYPLTSDVGCYKGLYDSNLTPIAKYVSENILALPLYGELSLKDVDRICRIIKD